MPTEALTTCRLTPRRFGLETAFNLIQQFLSLYLRRQSQMSDILQRYLEGKIVRILHAIVVPSVTWP